LTSRAEPLAAAPPARVSRAGDCAVIEGVSELGLHRTGQRQQQEPPPGRSCGPTLVELCSLAVTVYRRGIGPRIGGVLVARKPRRQSGAPTEPNRGRLAAGKRLEKLGRSRLGFGAGNRPGLEAAKGQQKSPAQRPPKPSCGTGSNGLRKLRSLGALFGR